jgi:hypothetical protein
MEWAAGVLLEPNVAAQVRAAQKRMLKRGVDWTAGEGYRDFAGQVFQKQRWTALGQPGNAATPGTSSHGLAQALDWNREAYTDAENQIISEELERMGLIQNISNESWHRANVGAITASLEVEDIIIPEEPESELDMKTSWIEGRGAVLMTDGGYTGLNDEEWGLFKRLEKSKPGEVEVFNNLQMDMMQNCVRRARGAEFEPFDYNRVAAAIVAKLPAQSIAFTKEELAKTLLDTQAERLRA